MTDTSITNSCSSCGIPLMAAASTCPNCGSVATKPNVSFSAGKSKAVAVVLAVFFGIFSWLYTYRQNSTRFWITLMVSAVASLLFVVGQASKDEWVQIYSASIFALGVLPFHAWAIFGSISKSSEYYHKSGR